MCICICVFACLTPQNIVIGVLVPRAFQKYSTCMVCGDFLISNRNSQIDPAHQKVESESKLHSHIHLCNLSGQIFRVEPKNKYSVNLAPNIFQFNSYRNLLTVYLKSDVIAYSDNYISLLDLEFDNF